MITVLLTMFGMLVFIISLFTTTFKVAFKRLAMFAITGLIIDAMLIGLTTIYLIAATH